jgi:branched-chain amino acid transport system substrate-binding protein
MAEIEWSNLDDRTFPCLRPRSFNSFILCIILPPLIAWVLAGSPAAAQIDPATPKPYASINRDAVSYLGPGRGAAYDLAGNDVTIGIMLPLEGQRAAEGRVLLQAAQLALEEEAANPLPDGRRLQLAVGDESGQWGQASNEIVRLIMQAHAVALITSAGGNIAHQAEQVSNKVGIPILTLSSDATTTEINIPWIFRLGPSDSGEAQAFAHEVYRKRGLSRVLLIFETDHDGRVGSEAFEKAGQRLGAAPPYRFEIVPTSGGAGTVGDEIAARNPEAVVLWTGPESATALLPLIRRERPHVPVYLCSNAAQLAANGASEPADALTASGERNEQETWVAVSSGGSEDVRREFERHLRERTGIAPSIAAAQAYDAVHVIAAALRRAGPNRARLRDRLAAGTETHGASGLISFDSAGNIRSDVLVVRLEDSFRRDPDSSAK